MHKRYVVATSNCCTTKSLSKLLTTCLHLISQHYKEYNKGIVRNTGANSFWIIDNTAQVLHTLNKLMIPLLLCILIVLIFLLCILTYHIRNLLLECLKSLVEEAYRVRGATHISIGYNKAYWTDNTEIGCICISEKKN